MTTPEIQEKEIEGEIASVRRAHSHAPRPHGRRLRLHADLATRGRNDAQQARNGCCQIFAVSNVSVVDAV